MQPRPVSFGVSQIYLTLTKRRQSGHRVILQLSKIRTAKA
jgi:hypothetical protein